MKKHLSILAMTLVVVALVAAYLPGGAVLAAPDASAEGKISSEQVDMIKKASDASYQILISKGYAKADEFEADAVGTTNIYKMGYTPYGVSAFLKRLRKSEKEKGANLKILLSTHPAPSQRVEKLEKMIEKNGWSPARPNLMERYQEMKSSHPIP